MLHLLGRKSPKIVPMTDSDLSAFVMNMCEGRIFTSAQLRQENLLHMVFMPLIFGALKDYSQKELGNIGILWEYLDQAFSRQVNGYPTFFSMRVMNRVDYKRAMVAYDKEMARRSESAKNILSA